MHLPLVIATMLALSSTDAPVHEQRVSLREAVRLAVENNLDLLQSRLAARRLDVLETAAWRAYTPELGVRTELGEVHAPGVKDGAGYTSSAVGIGWSAPIGTHVSAELQRVRSLDTNESDGALVLAVTQPLLRGAWFPGAGEPLSESSLLARIARETLRAEIDAFIVEVERAYWDLALAQADVEIKTRSRDRARSQHADTAENIRRGILADVEIYLVEENVVFFESELARAEEQRNEARRRLAALLWQEPDALLTAADDLAAMTGETRVTVPEVVASVQTASENSPLLAEQRLLAELARARQRSVVVNALPQLDLDGGLAFGAGGDLTRPGALSASSARPDAHVGVTLSMPLGPPPFRASVDAAHIDLQRANLELSGRELRLRHDIESAVGALALDVHLEQMGRRQLELAELKLVAQNDKYKNGISTLADVVRFQRELDDASITLRRRVRNVHVSYAELLAREGTLSRLTGVELQ